MGARQIVILRETAAGENKQVHLANAILGELFGQKRVVYQAAADTFDSQSKDDSGTAVLQNFYHDFSFTNRREKLADLLCFLRMQSVTESAIIQDVAIEDFGKILCDQEKCTQCAACVNECRTGALTADSEQYSLNHTPALCVQCGICVTICPENALTAEPGLFLEDSFFKETVMAQAEPARCKGCGKIFGTRKSLEKVIAILSAKNMWNDNDDLLSYCDSCRVVNLYESGKQV
jgi:ferredoxin